MRPTRSRCRATPARDEPPAHSRHTTPRTPDTPASDTHTPSDQTAHHETQVPAPRAGSAPTPDTPADPLIPGLFPPAATAPTRGAPLARATTAPQPTDVHRARPRAGA